MGLVDYFSGTKLTEASDRRWPSTSNPESPSANVFENPFSEPPSGSVTPHAALIPRSAPVPDIQLHGSEESGTYASSASSPRRLSLTGSVQSGWTEDIKHEVMVNYLFQHQCSSLWVGDGSGQVEGVILRKSRGNYISCPPQLVESPFGRACQALNVQVRPLKRLRQGNTNRSRSQ